jgi:hypothetical protein
MQGTLTAGVFNYLRGNKHQPYSLKSVLGSAYDYIYGEAESDPSQSLLTFMSQAPNFKMDRFKGKK